MTHLKKQSKTFSHSFLLYYERPHPLHRVKLITVERMEEEDKMEGGGRRKGEGEGEGGGDSRSVMCINLMTP